MAFSKESYKSFIYLGLILYFSVYSYLRSILSEMRRVIERNKNEKHSPGDN